MKKKTVKKLVLAKETVRSLQEAVLGQVAGGTEITVVSCVPKLCMDEHESRSDCHV